MMLSVERNSEDRRHVADAHALRGAIAVVVLVRSVMVGKE